MKHFMFLIFTLLSFSALATPVCDFPYDLSEDEGVRELSNVGIDSTTRLTRLQGKQIIESAKRVSQILEIPVPENVDVKWAIDVLSSDSESGDLSMIIFRFRGVVYTLVQYYPGGNPYGYVFKGIEVVARRTDGDLVCTEI